MEEDGKDEHDIKKQVVNACVTVALNRANNDSLCLLSERSLERVSNDDS